MLLIVWNYTAGTGLIFDVTIGELSDRYTTSLTPADYAFAIWGPIYFSLLVLCGFHLKRAFIDSSVEATCVESILKAGPFFFAAQLFCGAWLWAWFSEQILLSLILMAALFASLFLIILRWNMERDDVPWSVLCCEWWPISIYSGWISVALLANFGAYLSSLGVSFVSEPGWAIGLSVLLVTGHLIMIFSRNMREFSLVAVWALLAVAARHLESVTHGLVAQVALAGALLLLVVAGFHAQHHFKRPPSARTRRID